MKFLEEVAEEDVEVLREKEKSYGSSWKRRGGVGAFMMACRKFDRLENVLGSDYGYDIFRAMQEDSREEGIIDDIRDLRRYLLLIEAEARAQGWHGKK